MAAPQNGSGKAPPSPPSAAPIDEAPPAPQPPKSESAAPPPQSALMPQPERSALIPQSPPPRKIVLAEEDQYTRDNMIPMWNEMGLKRCSVCHYAITPKTGLCVNGGADHGPPAPYTPNTGTHRTVTLDGSSRNAIPGAAPRE